VNQEANQDLTTAPTAATTASLVAARQLLEAIDRKYPGGDEKRAGLFIGDDHLCVAVPWQDGYRIVALHEADYAVPGEAIVDAIGRFFQTLDAQTSASDQPAGQ